VGSATAEIASTTRTHGGFHHAEVHPCHRRRHRGRLGGRRPGIGPGGYGNAQDTINALQAQGFNVQLNGAAVYPLSGCKVTGIEGMHNDNINSAGAIIDPTKSTTVWVDISCKGG
jgi:hypothetical protein